MTFILKRTVTRKHAKTGETYQETTYFESKASIFNLLTFHAEAAKRFLTAAEARCFARKHDLGSFRPVRFDPTPN